MWKRRYADCGDWCARGALALAFVVLCAATARAAEPPASPDDHARVAASSWTICTAASRAMPDSVRVDSVFVTRLQEMLERSPTFRAQCRRLADAPWVHVAVRLDLASDRGQALKGWTVIQRPQKRLIVAIVHLLPSADPAIWLAHELEHIIEQIDRVDVRGLPIRPDQAWHVTRGMFETNRAVETGNTVFREMHDYPQGELSVD